MRKDFGSEFTFKPHSINDFQVFVILNINEEKFGGGTSLKLDSHNRNLLIKIFTPVINGELNIGAKYNLTATHGELLLHFNQAMLQVKYDLIRGSFSANTQFNVGQLLETLVGTSMDISIPIPKMIKFSAKYEQFKFGEIKLFLEDIGEIEATFKYRNFQFWGNFEVALWSRNISKLVHLSFDYRKSGIFEFFIKDGEESLEVKVSEESLKGKSRKIRAIVSSPSLGSTEINLINSLTQGIFVLSTQSGIHKLSYNIDKKDRTLISINVESPYLNNGFATLTFSINERRNVYEVRFSLNNDHFAFARLKLKTFGFESRFDLETTLLREKLSSELKYNFDPSSLSLHGKLTFSTPHKFDVSLNFEEVRGSVSLASVFIPHHQVSLAVHRLMRNNETEFKVIIKYGEEYFEVDGKLFILKAGSQFDGTLSFSSSEFSFLKCFICWSLDLSNYKVMLDVETSIPKFLKVFIKSELKTRDRVALEILIKLPIPDNFYEIEIDLTDIQNILLHLTTSTGMYVTAVSWRLSESGAVLSCKSSGPRGEAGHVLAQLQYGAAVTAHLDVFSSLLGRARGTFSLQENIQSFRNTAKFHLDINEDFLDFDISYDYIETIAFSARSKSSLEMFRSLGLVIGFENTERKTFKAHMNLFEKCTGIELDYFFNGVKNVSALVRIDNPFEDWSDFYGEFSTAINQEITRAVIGLKVYGNSLSGSVHYQHGRAVLDMSYYNDRLTFLLDTESKILELFLNVTGHELFLNFNTVTIEQKVSVVEFLLKWNRETKVRIYLNNFLKKSSIQVNNIYLPYYLDFDFTLDTDTNNMSNLKVFETNVFVFWNESINKQNSLGAAISFRNLGDGYISLKIPHRNPVKFSLAHFSFNSVSVTMVEICSKDENLVEYSIFRHHSTQITSDNFVSKDNRLQIYSNKYELKTFQTKRKDSKSDFELYRWGDSEDMKGLGYMVSERRSGGHDDTEILCFHQPADSEYNILSVTVKTEGEHVSCDVQFRDERGSEEFSVKIKSNFINSPKTLNGFFFIGYTFNKSELRFISADIILWKNEQKIEFKTSVNEHNLKLKVCERT